VQEAGNTYSCVKASISQPGCIAESAAAGTDFLSPLTEPDQLLKEVMAGRERDDTGV